MASMLTCCILSFHDIPDDRHSIEQAPHVHSACTVQSGETSPCTAYYDGPAPPVMGDRLGALYHEEPTVPLPFYQ
jgi:hypothetical protein